MLDNLSFLRKISWSEVFQVWKENEGNDPVWQEFAKKEKGWDSWEEWRSNQANLFGANEREWKLYEILNPNEIIPKFVIGPFQAWQNHFEEKHIHTFEDLAREQKQWLSSNTGVVLRFKNFPRTTQFIGLYLRDKDVVVLYEGHHRAAAVALGVKESKPILFTSNPTIALTEMSGDASELLNKILETKSNKPLK